MSVHSYVLGLTPQTKHIFRLQLQTEKIQGKAFAEVHFHNRTFKKQRNSATYVSKLGHYRNLSKFGCTIVVVH